MSAVTADFQADFDAFVAERSDEPAWLKDHRSASFAAFGDLGFPTRKNEEWKYISTRPIAKAGLRVTTEFTPTDLDAVVASARLGNEAALLVFVGGVFDAERSSYDGLADGITVARLSSSWDADSVAPALTRAPRHPSGFDALRGAFVKDGVFVNLAPDAELAEPIHVIHIAPSSDTPYVSASANVINVSGHARGTFVESYVGATDGAYLGLHGTTVRMGDGSALRHIRIQDEGAGGFHVGTDDVCVPRDAEYRSFNFSVGAKIARDTIEVRVEGAGAHTELTALYLPQSGQLHDNHTLIDHRAPSCTADQLYKGVLDGTGHGVFNGKIFVQQAAQQTAAEQLNQNLMLSETARIDTKPQLEIFADDVRCTHGATVGQLDPEEMFYMMSRAVPESAARRMLIRGFADDVIDRAEDEGAAARMRTLLDARFGS